VTVKFVSNLVEPDNEEIFLVTNGQWAKHINPEENYNNEGET